MAYQKVHRPVDIVQRNSKGRLPDDIADVLHQGEYLRNPRVEQLESKRVRSVYPMTERSQMILVPVGAEYLSTYRFEASLSLLFAKYIFSVPPHIFSLSDHEPAQQANLVSSL